MTVQASDIILINNEEYSIKGYPLDFFLNQSELSFELSGLRTGMLRGYYAKWEINDGKLFLIEFFGVNDFKQEEYDLDNLFPQNTGRVFAYWYSGDIIVPLGKQVEYFAGSIGSVREFKTTISIKNGYIFNSGSFQLNMAET